MSKYAPLTGYLSSSGMDYIPITQDPASCEHWHVSLN